MKIGPLTERWNDGEQDWSFVKDPTTDIEKWEQATGYKLPADYRNFMIRFNGGSIFPRHFHTRLVIGPAGPYHNESDVTFVDPIFAWYHTRTPWGEDGNNRIDPVAENFTAFLKSLFSEGDDDFESWRNPVFDRIAKDFEP